MCRELRTHLDIKHQLVIANDGFDPQIDMEWSLGQHINGWQPGGKRLWDVQKQDLEYWIKENKITTVIAIESSFGDNTFRWCKDLGVKVVLIVMWEAFNPSDPRLRNVDLYVCPSFKAFREVPFENKVYLPYPVDTNTIQFRERIGPAKVFVHNAGTGGVNGRKGTLETIKGFILAAEKNPTIKLLIRSQKPLHQIVANADGLLAKCDRIKAWYGTAPTIDELYSIGDVLIFPSKYEGHALVTLEAMAAGMPVITTGAEPMNEFDATSPLLVEVERRLPAGLLNPHCEQNVVDVEDLAEKILWAAGADLSSLSMRGHLIASEDHSWRSQKRRWKEALRKVEA